MLIFNHFLCAEQKVNHAPCTHTFTHTLMLAMTGKCGFWTLVSKVKQRLKENSFSVCPHLPFPCLTFHHKSFSGRELCKGIGPRVSSGPQEPDTMGRSQQRPTLAH